MVVPLARVSRAPRPLECVFARDLRAGRLRWGRRHGLPLLPTTSPRKRDITSLLASCPKRSTSPEELPLLVPEAPRCSLLRPTGNGDVIREADAAMEVVLRRESAGGVEPVTAARKLDRGGGRRRGLSGDPPTTRAAPAFIHRCVCAHDQAGERAAAPGGAREGGGERG